MNYFLGIDGGGTRTTAWVSDAAGKILSRAVAGPSNPLKVGMPAAQRQIVRAAREACREASARSLEAVCLGLAGSDRPQLHSKILGWLRKTIRSRCYMVTSDAAIALRAAIANSPGVIVISGTGSIAYGRDDRGRVLRAGGWGAYLDDAGSGYDLGRKAITAALRDHDGRGPYTQLTAGICESLEIADITHIVAKDLNSTEVAALFPLVIEAARHRDAVARQLCEEAGKDLADLALALLRRMGWLKRVVPVVYAGGVFRSSLLIRRSVTRYLRRLAPHARVLLLRHPPVEGALAFARDLAGTGSPRKTRLPRRH